MPFLPITAKLNPFAGAQNWVYLIYSTAITRLCTGFARVYQNRPSAQDPSLPEAEKRQVCLERFFIEIFGTTGYLIFLHLGQDITSKLFHPPLKKKLHEILNRIDDPASGLNPKEAEQVKTAITKLYGNGKENMIARHLYGYTDANKKTMVVNLRTLRSFINDDKLFRYVRSSIPLDSLAFSLRRRAAVSVFGGIAASALFGGLVTQWLNDRVFAPSVRSVLQKRFKTEPNVVAPQFSGPQASPEKPAQSWMSPSANPMTATSTFTPSTPAFQYPNGYSMPTAGVIPGVWSNTLGGLPR